MAACSARCSGVRSLGSMTPPAPRCAPAVVANVPGRHSHGEGGAPEYAAPPRRPGAGARNPVLSSWFRTQDPESLPGRSWASFCASAAVPANIIANTAADSVAAVLVLPLIVMPPSNECVQTKRVSAVAHPLVDCANGVLEGHSEGHLDDPLVVAVVAVGRPLSRGTEARVPRRQPVRIDRAVRQRLRVADRLVGRTVEGHRGLSLGDDGRVEQVERIHAHLELTGVPEADVARDREVCRVIGAALHDVAPRLQTDAVVRRAGDRGGVELAEPGARTPFPSIPNHNDPPPAA